MGVPSYVTNKEGLSMEVVDIVSLTGMLLAFNVDSSLISVWGIGEGFKSLGTKSSRTKWIFI